MCNPLSREHNRTHRHESIAEIFTPPLSIFIVQEGLALDIIGRIALHRFLLLSFSLITGLSVGVYEFLTATLPAVGFGIVLLLLIVAFLTGISLILRATARHIHRYLIKLPEVLVIPPEPKTISRLNLLFEKAL